MLPLSHNKQNYRSVVEHTYKTPCYILNSSSHYQSQLLLLALTSGGSNFVAGHCAVPLLAFIVYAERHAGCLMAVNKRQIRPRHKHSTNLHGRRQHHEHNIMEGLTDLFTRESISATITN